MKRFPRPWRWIVFALTFLLVVGGGYSLRLRQCYDVLVREGSKADADERWFVCYWDVDGKLTESAPTFFQFLAGTRPVAIALPHDTAPSRRLQDVKNVARALSVLKSLREITIQDGGEEVMIFLQGGGITTSLGRAILISRIRY